MTTTDVFYQIARSRVEVRASSPTEWSDKQIGAAGSAGAEPVRNRLSLRQSRCGSLPPAEFEAQYYRTAAPVLN
jgi:hypothetical protein